MAEKKIVLCSASPRRQELLAQMGHTQFDIRIPQVDETFPENLTAQEVVCHISRKKAEAAKCLCTADEVYITADTMVFLEDQRLGKPENEEVALSMLMALQGHTHLVCTGVTVGQGDTMITQCQTTSVTFLPATQETLRRYIATGEPMDKAGSYGIQGLGALLVESIQGDYFNVMGLPIAMLNEMLRGFEITTL